MSKMIFVLLFLPFMALSQSYNTLSDNLLEKGYHTIRLSEPKLKNCIFLGKNFDVHEIFKQDLAMDNMILFGDSINTVMVDRYGKIYLNCLEIKGKRLIRKAIKRGINVVNEEGLFRQYGNHISTPNKEKLPKLPNSDFSIQTPLTSVFIRQGKVYVNYKRI